MQHKSISRRISVFPSICMKKRGVVHQRLEGIFRILKDVGNCIDVEYLVFRKSFDLASHELFVYKMTKYSIERLILKLASNAAFNKLLEQKRKRNTRILEYSTVSVIRLQTSIRKMMHQKMYTRN